MKNYLSATICVIALCISCTKQKQAEFITRDLPNGIVLSNFNESYDSYKGTYNVNFIIKNTSDKKMTIPSISADIFVNGKKEGYSEGGSGRELMQNDSSAASISTILPKESADSVIFHFTGLFEGK